MWTVRALEVTSNGTENLWQRDFDSWPTIQMWDSGKTRVTVADRSYSRTFRQVDWIERVEIKEQPDA